jgi:hypothetical protein
MNSMSSHDADVPVEPHRYSGPHRVDIGNESEDEQASVVDEDIVVIETHDAAEESDSDASEHSEATPAFIWSAGPSGPAEAMAEESSAGDASWSAAAEVAPGPVDQGPAASESTAPGATSAAAMAATGLPGADAGQWSEIKAMFVDDPGESVKRASGMVERAVDNLMTSLRQQQESLDSWHANDAASTEALRNALRGYQSLFDQLDGMSDRFGAGRDRVSSS